MNEAELRAEMAALGVRVTALERGMYLIAKAIRGVGKFGQEMVLNELADQLDELVGETRRT